MQMVFTRFMLIVAFFIFWIGAIGVRLVHLQVSEHKSFRERALNQRRDVIKSKLLRGTIFDRNDRPLAMSLKVSSLYVDPAEVSDVDALARSIGKVLKQNPKIIARRINDGKKDDKRFVWIARKLDKDLVDEVNEKLANEDINKNDLPKAEGLHWSEEQKRSYPYKTMAAQVIGFSNSDDLGQAGIEMSQEDALRGEATKTWRERDRLGRVYDEWGAEREEPKDVVLTISNSIQYKVEEALARGAKRVNAKKGKAIVLNPKTGEILAMANYPSFDPNEIQKLKPGMWNNHAIQDNYAPGSVFKLITYGAALEEKLIRPNDQIDCGNGTITIARHTFSDSHAVGRVSYTDAFAQSSNVGAIKTATKVGKESFYKYARNFGFGSKTGIELPAETSGLLRPPNTWNGDSLASMSIGYEIGVTALQSATAFATIANDGVKIQPHIVKEIRKANGEIVSTTTPKKVQVVSTGTARTLRMMLQQVVLDGTAKRAQLNGYTSAGKTGTAWKYDADLKAVNRNKYVSSFIGFAPADNPEIVIAVVMDEPQGSERYGGQVAAPVFKEIAEQVLPELNVVPDIRLKDDFVAEQKSDEGKNRDMIPEEPPISDASDVSADSNPDDSNAIIKKLEKPRPEEKSDKRIPEKRRDTPKTLKPETRNKTGVKPKTDT